MVDPRSPVLVGAGQTSQRVGADVARPPIELFVDAARLAEADSGTRLLDRVDVVGIVQIASWRYADPGALAARHLGIAPRRTLVTTVGGNSPQLLLGELSARIQRGDCDVALLGGAECMYTRWRARREPRVELTWDHGDDGECPWVVGDDRAPADAFEMAHGIVAPVQVYPLIETALRAAAGRSVDQHREHVGHLWARFSAVAAANPAAWSRTAYDASEITGVTPDNRMVCFPYTKRMCSNIDVDQGAALLLCSYEAAHAAGVPDERIVFVHAGADAHDHWFLGERDALSSSPAIGAVACGALAAADIGVDDVAHLDLYSCFPSAVQLAQRALGLDESDERPLTVTGGLGFAGGPVNDYSTHALARMVEVLRGEPDAYGLATGLGWYATKHAAAVLSARPPRHGYRRVDTTATQATLDRLPRRTNAGPFAGRATVEATSVTVERDGTASLAIVTAIEGGGQRVFARTTDPDLARALTVEAWEGRSVHVSTDGSRNRFEG